VFILELGVLVWRKRWETLLGGTGLGGQVIRMG